MPANWAGISSLVETCKLNGVDPQAYLTDVLTKLVNLCRDRSRATTPGLRTIAGVRVSVCRHRGAHLGAG
jgi:hypothetical protein